MKMSVSGLMMVLIGAISCSAGNAAAQSAAAVSELKTAAIFSDNMVLQQGQPIRVWGWASDGAKVTVDLNNQKASAEAANGKWMASLKAIPLGGPYTMTISAGDKIADQKPAEILDGLVARVGALPFRLQ